MVGAGPVRTDTATIRVDVNVKGKSTHGLVSIHGVKVPTMRIGEVAQRSGVSTRALRYYEEQGLIAASRTVSGQRTYAESAVDRVRLIQNFFAAGLPSRTILKLLPCYDTATATAETFALLEAERVRISESMDSLAAARNALDRMIDLAHHPAPEHCPALRETPAVAS